MRNDSVWISRSDSVWISWNDSVLIGLEKSADALFKAYQQTVCSSTAYSFQQMATVNFNQQMMLTTSTCVTLNGSGIQLAVGPQPLRLRNHNFGLTHRIMVKRLATSPHDPLGITDSICKNQLVVVSVQYGPFNTYIPIRSTTIGKSRVAKRSENYAYILDIK
ncbi:cleavage stimulation factor subunit 2-like [Dorcoceras hygrometricum]|uniref:Cleavage stimulation factor subunit 2-like n=1 Tax=Dorcoceras hygrometricum TaxID=472368 RepID=A0A2Z7ASW6_9LAMI|nr:cleavage stimulation factor subunit 2-like [Dorcoceras hygrometricum]